MKKLMDIKGYWNFAGDYSFNDNEMWEGKILLDEDGWFEGIANDPNSGYTKDRLIFGVYHPGKIIELVKVSPKVVSDPFVFRGKRDVKGYDGKLSVIGLCGEMDCGVCHIITQYAEDEKNNDRNIEEEIKDLLKRIEAFKATSDYDDLYNYSYNMKDALSEVALRQYEKRPFSPEEAQKIIEKTQPVEEKVVTSTLDGIKKLIKKGDNLETDLPF